MWYLVFIYNCDQIFCFILIIVWLLVCVSETETRNIEFNLIWFFKWLRSMSLTHTRTPSLTHSLHSLLLFLSFKLTHSFLYSPKYEFHYLIDLVFIHTYIHTRAVPELPQPLPSALNFLIEATELIGSYDSTYFQVWII